MKRSIAKKNVIMQRSRPRVILRWIYLASTLVIFFCGSLFFIYHKQIVLSPASSFTAYYASITTWAAERHHHLVKKVVEKKQALLNGQEVPPPPIHFEFYTTLPNMQVAANSVPKKTESASIPKKNLPIFNSDDLENQLSTAVKKVR